jgi:type VI secretion system secreted protein VgrG
LQIEREEAFHRQLRGASSVSGLDAGMRVKIKGLEVNEKEEPEVLIIAVRHSAMDYSHWTTEAWSGREPGAPHYDNEFVCIRKSMKFRPERVTPKPFVHGPQTAIVTGLSGEEIHTDAYGRVKVQFHWDRVGRKDETSSCWVRVSQGWAGKNWGQIHIPRVGHEVIVDFLEGDPDRPIITGRVYNAENPVPYSLPEKKTQSGIKSNSTKDGDGSNEIRFEDLKGSEEIFIHAERDYNTKIENDETRVVGGKGTGNRTTTIKNDETTTIKGNKTTTVEMDFNETITGTETRKVTGDVTETYIANETRTIGGSVTETVTGSFTRTITGSVTDTITGSLTMSVVGGVTVTSPAPINLTSSVAINQTAPSLMQTTPNFYNTGATSGDAYGFVQSNSGFKIENMGAYISTIVTKMDNFGLAIANGGIEIKNKSMKAYTYTFALKTGFTLHS